ncbi:MAG: siroheme synthase CysG [Wenzhouxiangellaceae bacterium]
MKRNDATPGGRWLPLFLDLQDRPVLVVGGGVEARRKIDRMLRHGACVDVLADRLEPVLADYEDNGRIRRLERVSRQDYRLIVLAERDNARAEEILAFARAHNIPVNAVDDPDRCDALMPAIVDRAPLTIAIGSGGEAPELARMIRSRIEALIPQHVGKLARLASRNSPAIRARFPSLPRRRRFLNWLFSGRPAELVSAGDDEQAEKQVRQALATSKVPATGSVALVGAGPGDPELLTVKALRLIQEADAIVHDALIDPRVLEFARRDAELFDVGKRGGRCSTPQLRIHTLLLELVQAGKRVVRLKGGDPMVFGRGGEELEFLRAHDIEYSVVPGITAAAGCAAYAGIPLTHRDHAQSVHLVTAHGQQSIDRLDWASLARERQTLAFYMAVSRINIVQANLLEHGRSPDTPVAIVENGARPEQRVLTSTLGRVHDLARRHRLMSPAMLFIGEVAQLADRLTWWGDPPLTIETMPTAKAWFTAERQAVHR